jgi:2-C-methyl-D-erythritol 4-phosphate cytidylyltransferase/2-C-methyl-D-erythritol 2,4-cyclodiphosphate synthase
MENRTGYGYDVHQFNDTAAPNSHIMLCGVAIPHDHQIIAHSDGDVALHALTDAILGAIGDGDIGVHFPPSDERWKDASSDQFLADACQRLRNQHGRIVNCDITVIAEAPKITPHRDAMRQTLSGIMGIEISRISIKATTSENMGFIGRGEGIAAHAMVSVLLPSGSS